MVHSSRSVTREPCQVARALHRQLLCPQPCTQHLGKPPHCCQFAVSKPPSLVSLSAAIPRTRRASDRRCTAREMAPLAPAGTSRSQVASARQRSRKAPVLWATDGTNGEKSSYDILVDWLSTSGNYARCSRSALAAFPLESELWLPDGEGTGATPRKRFVGKSWGLWWRRA